MATAPVRARACEGREDRGAAALADDGPGEPRPERRPAGQSTKASRTPARRRRRVRLAGVLDGGERRLNRLAVHRRNGPH